MKILLVFLFATTFLQAETYTRSFIEKESLPPGKPLAKKKKKKKGEQQPPPPPKKPCNCGKKKPSY